MPAHEATQSDRNLRGLVLGAIAVLFMLVGWAMVQGYRRATITFDAKAWADKSETGLAARREVADRIREVIQDKTRAEVIAILGLPDKPPAWFVEPFSSSPALEPAMYYDCGTIKPRFEKPKVMMLCVYFHEKKVSYSYLMPLERPPAAVPLGGGGIVTGHGTTVQP